jgi:hypothetical protein
MRSARILLVLAMIGAALAPAGCATPPKGEAFRPEIVDPARGVIYIYRTGRGSHPVPIVINQKSEGELLPGQYMARVVDPGEYFVRAGAEGSAVRQAKVVHGDAVYFEVHTGRWNNRATMEVPDNITARQRIARASRPE